MRLWVQNDVGCYEFHEVNSKLIFKYHAICHILSVYDCVPKVINVILSAYDFLCMYVCIKESWNWPRVEDTHKSSIVATSFLMTYNKHMLHEKWLTPTFQS